MNLKEFIIPAIDIKEGKVVRLYKGEFEKSKVYYENPADVAKFFGELGFKKLHVVDLDGAKEGKPVNLKHLENIRKVFPGEIEVGGGIRNYKTAKTFFDTGVDYIVVGTLAVKNPQKFERILASFPDKVILAIDSKGGKIAVGGWLEETPLTPDELAKRYEDKPVWGYLYTIVERDGSLEGVDTKPYEEIKKFVKKPVLASGGVSSLEDVKKLYNIVEGVVVGRAIYEGRIKVEEL